VKNACRWTRRDVRSVIVSIAVLSSWTVPLAGGEPVATTSGPVANAGAEAIRWERRGATSGRPLVFLPELGLPASIWSKVYAQFEQTHPIYLVTYAGTDGIPPIRPPSLDRIVDDIVAHIRADRLEKPVLIGHLFGGHVALRVAAQAPDLTSGVFAMPPPAIRLPMEIRLSIAKQAAESYLKAEPRMWRPNFAIEIGRAIDDPSVARQLTDDLARSDRETYALLVGEAFADPLDAKLGKIEAPVCIVAPAELPRPDPTAKEAQPEPNEIANLVTEWYAQSYPGIRRCDVRAIKRTRTYSILEAPGLVGFTLGRFLENVEKRDLHWSPTPSTLMPTSMMADGWREIRDSLIRNAGAATTQSTVESDLRGVPESLRSRVLDAERKDAESPSAAGAGKAGMLWLALGRPQRAIPHFDNASRLEKRSVRWPYLLGLSCERAGQRQPAIAAYRRAVAIDDRCAPAVYRLALALKATQLDEAYQLLQRAAVLDQTDPGVLIELGRVERGLNLSETALGHYQQALKLSPDCSDAHRECAALLRSISRNDEANKHTEAWAAAGAAPPPKDPFLTEIAGIMPAGELETAAKAAIQAHETDAAIDILELALRQTPESVALRQLFAQALDAAGRHAAAAEQYRVVALSGTPDPSVWDQLGDAMRQSNSPFEAVALFAAASQRYPNDQAVSLWLGQSFAQLGRTTEALKLLDSVPESSPLYARARFEIGSLRAESGDHKTARAEFEQSIRADPKLADAYLALLKLARDSRNATEAVRILQRGADACPENPQILSNLAWILATDPDDSRRNGPEAVRLGIRSCALTGYSDPDCLDNLAAACAETGQFKSAAWLAERAQRIARKTGRKDLAADIEDRFKHYSAGLPFRETESSSP